MDGIVSKVGKKGDIIIIPDKTKIKNGLCYEFDFANKNTKEILGIIRYEENHKRLIIQNDGRLETGDLLLGGTKDILDQKEIIGRFGEGMKLAALAFVREKKNFIIITGKKQWSFCIKTDSKFIKNGQPQNCLHFMETDYDDENLNDKVTVKIWPIDLEKEWIPQIYNYLWLLKFQKKQINLGIVQAVKNNEVFGEILLNPLFKNKIYVKDIFVQKTVENSEATTCWYGFNTDLVLDRDRNAIKDLDARHKMFSEILANILNRMDDPELNKNIAGESRKWFDNFLHEILFLTDHCYYTVRYLNNYLTPESRDAIWEQKKIETKGKNDETRFVYYIDELKVNNFLREKKLNQNFYPYKVIDSWMTWPIIHDSKKYKHWEVLYNEKIENADKSDTPVKLNPFINEIVELVKKVKNDFKYDSIKFKKYEYDSDEIVYFDEKNNLLYLSSKLENSIIDEKKKKWLLKIICYFYKVDLIELIFKMK